MNVSNGPRGTPIRLLSKDVYRHSVRNTKVILNGSVQNVTISVNVILGLGMKKKGTVVATGIQ
jgi:hypothetical protein